MSRNLSIWHDELCMKFGTQGMHLFKLPGFFKVKVHRGFHSDFYWLEEGAYSRQQFIEVLRTKLNTPSYLSFLKTTYLTSGNQLLYLAKKIRSDVGTLKRFLRWYGVCQSLLDITAISSKVITDEIVRLLPRESNRLALISYYGQPRQLSPIQRLERELATFSKNKTHVNKNAVRLWKRYCWIPINFVGEPWDVHYFVQRLRTYRSAPAHHPVKPKQHISPEIRDQLRLLSLVTYLNEYRKAVFTQANYIIRPVFDELAKAHGLAGWQDMNLLTSDEIIDLARGRHQYQRPLIAQRCGLLMVYNDTLDSVRLEYGRVVKKFESQFQEKIQGQKYVQGLSARVGLVRGTVRIVLDQNDFSKFKRGDILVAKMTSTDFAPIMRKAAAFVTDEGGLASHAAILAREYNIPCIVGTRIGTRVFKSGDRVEVNANKGIIKKLT